jgi:hypothetical protein
MLFSGSRVLALLATVLLAAGCCTPEYIHTDRLPDGTVGQPYSFHLQSNCDRDSACDGVWRTVGVLPPGLELSHDGRLFGRPTLAGSYLVTVSLEDCGGDLVTTKGLSLTVNAPR